MPAWKSLHDIEAWKLARRICKQVTYITNQPCYRKDSGLRRQMLNSSGSMMDNIAEGFGRGSNAEFKTLVGYSKGSAEELYTQLIRSHDKGYMSDREFETLRYNVLLFGRHCGGIIRSIKDRKEERGYRFQEDPALYQYTNTQFRPVPVPVQKSRILQPRHGFLAPFLIEHEPKL